MGSMPTELAQELDSIADWGGGGMRVFWGTEGGGGAKLAIEKCCVADSGVHLYSWLESRLVGN